MSALAFCFLGDYLRECLHFLFISEKKVRKKTPRDTHGFATSFNALHHAHNAAAPRVDFFHLNFV